MSDDKSSRRYRRSGHRVVTNQVEEQARFDVMQLLRGQAGSLAMSVLTWQQSGMSWVDILELVKKAGEGPLPLG